MKQVKQNVLQDKQALFGLFTAAIICTIALTGLAQGQPSLGLLSVGVGIAALICLSLISKRVRQYRVSQLLNAKVGSPPLKGH
ncbi:hypothetical protein CXF83_12810 [Shewanella sp. Choline-02u-19]|uniref:hypothetical protein n=1 Tax=unclassified Shewanella TaxID=196818 RepID=UPI000C3452DE|nr:MULTISPECIES: hypothetical protein [unclassified Shewanella]PKG59143.1 hypothetical protein CXF82_00805 [Shewanella sp. GutDb-MelDb]PKG73058.1 hypothetical protein CXF86_19650 [Shewanella sp. GutCb]PKH56386.1 hypothetical protein CXF84_13905 [Shewanella sp. Bg11-22]PKI27519.1 hypothetical protein CXF83_12810 [Shewanella sp. Choline-02u-19]